MERLATEHLCEQINRRLSALAYSYRDENDVQTLKVEDRAEIRFLASAGGGVAGGSAAWVRAKHQKGGIHEPGLVAALLAISDLAPNIKDIFDIGALYGYVALIGGAIFSGAHIHAFEVNPNSFRALKNNIKANSSGLGSIIAAHHCALSDASMKGARMRVQEFTVTTGIETNSVNDKGSVTEIDMWSLDDFCAGEALLPELIKIDVEGYQAKIIPGAMGIISRARPVVLLEFDGKDCDNDFGVSNKEVIRPLIDMGYKLIWGRHRATNPTFREIPWAHLSDEHEVNSLGILVP